MIDTALLRRLCEAPGVSGQEDAVRDLIRREAEPFAARLAVTPLGSLIVEKQGLQRARMRLMLIAPMDEPGLLVKSITKEGFLTFHPVGNLPARLLCGRPARIFTEKGELPAVIGAKPIHLAKPEERGEVVPIRDLFLDIGASSQEEAAEWVEPGDAAVPDGFFLEQGGLVRGRALAGRAACALLLALIRSDLPRDVTFVFSAQSETGSSGACTAAYTVKPETAIAVCGAEAADAPPTEEARRNCRIGGGPVLRFQDHEMLYDRTLYRLARETAEAAGLPFQVTQEQNGVTDAAAVAVSRGGVRTAAVGFACRYPAGPLPLASLADLELTERLLRGLIERITGGFSENI